MTNTRMVTCLLHSMHGACQSWERGHAGVEAACCLPRGSPCVRVTGTCLAPRTLRASAKQGRPMNNHGSMETRAVAAGQRAETISMRNCHLGMFAMQSGLCVVELVRMPRTCALVTPARLSARLLDAGKKGVALPLCKHAIPPLPHLSMSHAGRILCIALICWTQTAQPSHLSECTRALYALDLVQHSR